MFEENYRSTTFNHREENDGVSVNIERRLDDKTGYDDVVNEFVWFLQNMGYTYIGGLIVLDDEGRELHNTML
jgi:hypothetical protein